MTWAKKFDEIHQKNDVVIRVVPRPVTHEAGYRLTIRQAKQADFALFKCKRSE